MRLLYLTEAVFKKSSNQAKKLSLPFLVLGGRICLSQKNWLFDQFSKHLSKTWPSNPHGRRLKDGRSRNSE